MYDIGIESPRFLPAVSSAGLFFKVEDESVPPEVADNPMALAIGFCKETRI